MVFDRGVHGDFGGLGGGTGSQKKDITQAAMKVFRRPGSWDVEGGREAVGAGRLGLGP